MKQKNVQSQEQRKNLMLNEPIDKIILKMAVPTIVAFLITSIYSLADTYFVSSLGASATAAVSFVRAHAAELGVPTDFYRTYDLHIHVPEGATPKDGPSAGITMATAVTSALTGRPVRRDVAMTGEITLRGRVLPIGGLKEKSMAAYLNGIKTVIVPKQNNKDVAELPDVLRQNLRFVPVDTAKTVLKTALR